MVPNSSSNTQPKLSTGQRRTQIDIRRRESKLAFLSLRFSSILLLLKLLTACSNQSSTDELVKELQKVKSWTATAHMVGEAWTRGNVPEAYAKQTLEKTQEELKSETDKLSKLSIEPLQRHSVLDRIKHIEDTVGQMSKVVEQKDRKAIAQPIQELSMEEQTIDKLTKVASGQS